MTAWRWTLAFGIVAFAFTLAFGAIPGLVACAPVGTGGPILAFELVRTPGEVAALFGSEPCRAPFVAAQRTGLWIDALGFIPSYSAFLIAALCAAGAGQPRTVLLGIVAVLVAAICDEFEGVSLFAILRALPGSQSTIDLLIVFVRVKFALLALATAGVGVFLILRRGRLAIAFGGGIAAFALLGLVALATDPMAYMTAAFSVSWVLLLACALPASIQPSLFSARAGQPR